jgi:antitoxin Phd
MKTNEKGRVLIVEKNPSVLHSFSNRLSKAGFQVTEASEPESALRQIESANFDVLVSGVKIPEIDGLTLLRRVRGKSADLQIVLILETPDNQLALRASELGVHQFLVKPVKLDILEETVNLATRLNREGARPRGILSRRPYGRSASVTATEAKNEFGRFLEMAMQGDIVVITKHQAPKAVLLSMDEFEALSSAPEARINTLNAEFDALLARMQGPEARNAMQAAFDASPEQLGKTAVAAVRKRG